LSSLDCQYNVSELHKCLWIAPERTGSRKVAEILGYFGFEHAGKKVYFDNERVFTHSVCFPEKYKDYKIICNARNPYAKTLAIYMMFYQLHQTEKTKESFKNYLKVDLQYGQTLKMVQNPVMDVKPDHIIRLEHMVEDFKKIPFVTNKLSDTQLELLCSHPVPLRDWESFYDEESKEIVYEKCSHLFDMWGYKK
jgi:hypothetical protein